MKKIAIIILLCFVTGGFSYGEELNIYNWSEYIDPALIKTFEKQTGIHVTYEEYETDEILFSRLKEDAGYDLIVPSNAAVPRLIKGGHLLPVDHALIPNFQNVDTLFKNPPYDPGNRYSVAYLWGTVGLIWRKDKIKDFTPTWASISDPDKQPGPFVLLDDFVDMTGVALKYLGYSANTKNKNELRNLEAATAEDKEKSVFPWIHEEHSGKGPCAFRKGCDWNCIQWQSRKCHWPESANRVCGSGGRQRGLGGLHGHPRQRTKPFRRPPIHKNPLTHNLP